MVFAPFVRQVDPCPNTLLKALKARIADANMPDGLKSFSNLSTLSTSTIHGVCVSWFGYQVRLR